MIKEYSKIVIYNKPECYLLMTTFDRCVINGLTAIKKPTKDRR